MKAWIRQLLNEGFEYHDLNKEATGRVKDVLSKYKDCKIGKTGNIDTRFDTTYREQGYIDLLKVVDSTRQDFISQLETDLIKNFDGRIMNDKKEDQQEMANTGEYWIYIVHKGHKS